MTLQDVRALKKALEKASEDARTCEAAVTIAKREFYAGIARLLLEGSDEAKVIYCDSTDHKPELGQARSGWYILYGPKAAQVATWTEWSNDSVYCDSGGARLPDDAADALDWVSYNAVAEAVDADDSRRLRAARDAASGK